MSAERDREVLAAMDDYAAAGAEVCEFDGHEWTDAGGGLLICGRCLVEAWASEHDTGAA